jgi:hypothetical protein
MSEEICSYTNMQCLLKLQLVGSIPPVWAGVGFAYFIAEIVDGNLVGNDAPAGPMCMDACTVHVPTMTLFPP